MSKADKKAEKAAKFAAKQAAQAATPAEKKEPTSQDDAKGKKDKDKKKGQDKFTSEETKTSFGNNIPTGQRKPFKEPIAEAYHPQAVEATWDSWWEAQGLYAADNESKDEKFVIVIPPPNVTGTLHLGHALTCSIEDAICRWNRMCGKNVCWVPGTDHAGIATQVVVEKKIWREEKKTRHDLGREEFIKRVWQWKETNGNRIYSQLRRLGASVDWNHESFTMDENLSRAVQEAFLRLHADGLIYRANRLVQWSCTLRTAISTIEVETQELTGPTKIKVPGYKDPIEFGVIHSFAYKVEGSEDEIIVATTRIETMLGDVAVAVHPDDERYKKYHGKYLIHPFVKRRIALVTDPVLVDMSFGTGAVKVTPAHDANDFACGQRHNLPQINIFTNDGNINDEGGVYTGRPRFQARLDIIKDLEALGLYRGKAANPMALGICSRSKDVLEPVLRPQWYVNCKSMAAAAVDAAKKGELQFIPSVHERIWYNWLENIQDWCISRQLWWGHRIPAYHVTMTGQDSIDDENHWIVAPTQDKAMDIANQRFPESKGKITLTQDPDVLDTWFSSGLFPFSVFGWPNVDSKDFKAFYPGNLLETGHDILFFWVARMVMMGLQLTKTLPFTKVFLHAMVRDKFGRKMSKSLGNVVDPLDVMDGISLDALNQKLLTGNLDPTETKVAIEGQKRDFPDGIAECGADALRFGLLAYTSQGRDINLDIQRVVAYRQFCNKIWQATRFAIVFHFDATFKKPDSLDTLHKAVSATNSFADRWILSRLHATTVAADKGFNGYEFADVTQAIYGFWLYDLCDNYLEMIKPIVKDTTPENNARRYAALSTLYICIEHGLKLLHPLMPFVTEELYHYLPGKDLNLGQQPLGGKSGSGSIMIQSYPRPADTSRFGDAKVESDMKIFQEISHAARAARASFGLTKKRVDIHITCQTPELVTLIQSNARDISTLSVANEVYALSKSDKVPDGCLSEVISPQLELHIPLAGLVDVGQEIVKLENRLDKLKEMIKSQEDRIASQGFQKSSDAIKQTANEKLASDQEELTKVEAQITKFKSMLTPEQRTKYIQDKITDKQNSITKCQATLDKLKKNLPADISTAPKKTLTMIAETEAEIASLSAAIAVLQQPSCVATGCNNPGIHACSKCLNARYCSKECQTRHWKHHKPTCQSHPN